MGSDLQKAQKILKQFQSLQEDIDTIAQQSHMSTKMRNDLSEKYQLDSRFEQLPEEEQTEIELNLEEAKKLLIDGLKKSEFDMSIVDSINHFCDVLIPNIQHVINLLVPFQKTVSHETISSEPPLSNESKLTNYSHEDVLELKKIIVNLEKELNDTIDTVATLSSTVQCLQQKTQQLELKLSKHTLSQVKRDEYQLEDNNNPKI